MSAPATAPELSSAPATAPARASALGVVTAAALVLALAGCGGSRSGGTGTAAGGADLPPCPRVAVIEGLDRVAVYRGGAATGDEADLTHLAAVELVAASCADTGDGTELELSVNLLAARGPAHAGDPARLTYFLALLDGEQRMVDKQIFTSTIALSPAMPRDGVVERLRQRLPGIAAADAAGYSLLIGFQIDPDDAPARL